MILKALVLDDQYRAREAAYRALATESKGRLELHLEAPPSSPFEAALVSELSASAHVALVDIFLDDRLEPFEISRGVDALTLVHDANPAMPVFLVSDKWDRLTLPILDRLLRSKKVVGGLTVNQLERPEERSKARFEIAKACRDVWGWAHTELDPDASLTILHLSDLQFGGPSASPSVAEHGARIAAELFDSLPLMSDGYALKPQILAVTGDVAQVGAPSEFKEGLRFLRILQRELAIPIESCFVVPGNHDVSFPLAAAPYLSFDFRSPFSAALGAKDSNPRVVHSATADGLDCYGLAPFYDFSRSLGGRDEWTPQATADCPLKRPTWFTSETYVHLGVRIIGLNTVGLLGPEDPSSPKIPEDAVIALGNHLDRVRARPLGREAVNVVLLHHSPWAGIGKESLGADGEFLLSRLASRGDAIILFGHIHQQIASVRPFTAGHDLQAVHASASTLALAARARPEDTLRGFNLLQLNRSGGAVVGAEIAAYSFLNAQYTCLGIKKFQREPGRGWRTALP